jgi:AbrB family looped-hinge helix DNA binding protein
MDEFITTVTQKGQVTIPGELRKALRIKPRDRIAFALVNGEVRLRPVRSPVLSSFGAVKPKGKPQDYRKMRREVEEEIAEEVSGGA